MPSGVLLKLNLILPSRLFCLALLGIIEYGFHLYGVDSFKCLRRRRRKKECIAPCFSACALDGYCLDRACRMWLLPEPIALRTFSG